jgi:PPK2 family polyphosphate:nucleotide phosphotransferase
VSGGALPGGLDRVLDGVQSPWRIPADGGLTEPPRTFAAPVQDDGWKKRLEKTRKAIRPYQRMLYASRTHSVLLVFQALDAAGKDGVIREVFEDLDPVNVQVRAFKRPTETELRHDFLWRTARQLPERGEIAVFNRSYYEEVLTVRVHPEFLEAQYGGAPPPADTLWPGRYRAIREHERHLATANTLILKFWLNVSPKVQARRFIERLDDPQKRWKFSLGDIRESKFRDAYDQAVLHMLNETSRPWAPWFCLPADDRWYLRWQVAEILRSALAALPLAYPEAEEIPADTAAEVRELLRDRIADED